MEITPVLNWSSTIKLRDIGHELLRLYGGGSLWVRFYKFNDIANDRTLVKLETSTDQSVIFDERDLLLWPDATFDDFSKKYLEPLVKASSGRPMCDMEEEMTMPDECNSMYRVYRPS